jgi:hypothetical protein
MGQVAGGIYGRATRGRVTRVPQSTARVRINKGRVESNSDARRTVIQHSHCPSADRL